MGSRKNAIWRIVVADRRSPRDGRFIEMIGHYNPQTQPSQIVIDRERLQHWLDRGAEPSNTVKKLMRVQAAGAAGATAATDEPAAAEAAKPRPEREAPPATESRGEDDAAAPETDPVEQAGPAASEDPASEGDTESG